MDELKKQFMHRELCALSFIAAFGMARKIPFYKKDVNEEQREDIKNYFRNELWGLMQTYSNKVSEEDHLQYIEDFQNKANSSYLQYLEGTGLTFGRTQKLINLYLKYIWVCGYIPEPPHCPIDSIIISKLGKEFNSLRFNKINKQEYLNIIAGIKNIKGAQSIAVWELSIFNRR